MTTPSLSSRTTRHRLLSAALLLCVSVAFTGVGCRHHAEENEVAPAAEMKSPRGLAPSGQAYSEDRTACADRDPQRQALWGELHVHSSLSMDAWLWDVRNGPDETFRFAKGEETRLPPLDGAGNPTRPARLERPLDFASLTDHALPGRGGPVYATGLRSLRQRPLSPVPRRDADP